MQILNHPLLSSKRNRYIAIALLLLFVIIFWRIFNNIQENKKRAARASGGQVVAVQYDTVKRGSITPILKFSGSLEPIWQADISSKVASRIDKVLVYEGDVVKEGQVLAVLDSIEYKAQSDQAHGSVYESRANLEQAELNLSRMEKLYASGAVSKQALDTAQFTRDMARGKLTASSGNYEAMQSKFDSTTILAPRSGVIARKYLQDGAFAPISTPIVNLADTSQLLAKVSIGEAEIVNLALGQEAILLVTAYGSREFKGRVTRISPVASLPARSFTAEITVDNTQNELKGGMYTNSFITTKQKDNVLIIPQSAIVMREDQKTVFVVNKDNVLERKLLNTGYIGEGLVEVISGIEEGETIVTGGQNRVREGSKVRPEEIVTGGK